MNNKWWPKLWATEFDQCARPRSRPALQAFHWPDEVDDLVTPRIGWERWFDNMTRAGIFVLTLATVDDA
eukprot:9226448-Pyramimonas_sp.AAC.1